MMTFTLSDKELDAAKAFVAECKQKLLEKQRLEMSAEDFEHLTGGGRHPYTGAIGGGVEYIFCPTSIGVGVSVRCFGEERNVTDYDNW